MMRFFGANHKKKVSDKSKKETGEGRAVTRSLFKSENTRSDNMQNTSDANKTRLFARDGQEV